MPVTKVKKYKKKYKTIRLSDAEYMLVSELQRLVKRKGYDALRKVLTPAGAILLEDSPRCTKGLAIAVSMRHLTNKLEWV